MTEPVIRAATAADFGALCTLLREGGLPTDDLRADALGDFLVADADGALLASVGLEVRGDVALLRSLAVAARLRRQGWGTRLTAVAEAHARGRGVRTLYLLTTTAEAFFAAHGYRHCVRGAAPAAIAALPQFAGLCPSTSAFMSKTIMSAPHYNILFLCTGNSARSILAEAAVNHLPVSRERFTGYSAGSRPRGEVNPHALELLARSGIATDGLRSKSWDEFAGPDAPKMDFVITVCDSAAGEQCPYWPGQPMTAHWGMPDPAAVEGSDEAIRQAFAETLRVLRRRIELLASLPVATLDRMALQHRVREIGQS